MFPGLEPSREATIQAILAWKKFTPAYAEWVLKYLLENAGPANRTKRSQAAIREKLFRNETLVSCNVPMRVIRINKKLEAFFAGPGRSLEWRVRIKTGDPDADNQYDVIFEPFGEELLRRFWARHFTPGELTRVAYGEPLFWRVPDSSVYLRTTEKNAPGPTDPKDWVTYPFVTLGDLGLLWNVGQLLTARGIAVDINAYRHESTLVHLRAAQKVHDENLLLVGTPRSNGIVREYAKNFEFKFTIDETSISAGAEPFVDRNHPGKTDVQLAYAVVSRRPGIEIGTVTIVASNNGRAIQAVGELLTSGKLLTELVTREPQLSALRRELPDRFQILFEFELTDQGTFVQSTRVVDVWNLAKKGKKHTIAN